MKLLLFFASIIFFIISDVHGQKQATQSYDVLVVPTEDFPFAAANTMAEEASRASGLSIKVSLPLPVSSWIPYPDRPQYDPNTLVEFSQPVCDRLKSQYGASVCILLTTYDLAPPEGDLNFVLSFNQHETKTTVISAARLIWNERGKIDSQHLIQSRLHKLMLRTIALQYYELERSTDLLDITYSPLMSVEDLDAMGMRMILPRKRDGLSI